MRSALIWILSLCVVNLTASFFTGFDVVLQQHNILFENVSLGYHYDYLNEGHQCNAKGLLKGRVEGDKAVMAYTPNRKLQRDTVQLGLEQKLRLAVVLAVGGHSDSHYNYGPAGSINGLMAVWDSWNENFFSVTSNTTSLILLFDERDFRRQNYTHSKSAYLDNILVKNMGAKPVSCIHMVSNATAHHKKKHCSNELYFDQGYHVYYVPTNATHYEKPLIIYAAVHNFPIPFWVKNIEEEDELFKTWKPWRLNRRYPTNYGYVKMTNWYSYYMLKLQLLDFFDYGGKLDNDVSFVAPFPEPNLPYMLAKGGNYMMATQNGWYHDDPRISQGVQLCLKNYLSVEAKHCNELLPSNSPHKVKDFIPAGINDTTFWETSFNTTFRAHFLVFWFGLYTAPEVKYMAKFWNDFHPRGMWDFRWGDQQWWPRPIAMYGSGDLNKEIMHYDLVNTDNGKYVVHKEWPRWGTIPLVLYFQPNGTTKDERDQMYAKAAKKFIY